MWQLDDNSNRRVQCARPSMTARRFAQLVAKALRGIPSEFRDEMPNVAIVVEDRPSRQLLEGLLIEPPDTLYGLYQWLPESDWARPQIPPDRITIYREPILGDSDGEDAVVRAIRETLIREFGHCLGLNEEQIEGHCQFEGRIPN